MGTYHEYCPIAKGAEVIGDRWNLLILRELMTGVRHFNDLHRFLPGISRSVLIQRLNQLRGAGVVERRLGSSKREVEYVFSEAGEQLQPIVLAIGNWATRWAFPDEPEHSEMDPLLVMAWLFRHLNRPALPDRRVVISFRLQGPKPGRFWMVLDPGRPSLCLRHPGFDEDIEVAAETRVIYQVYFGRISMKDAIQSGQVQVAGTRADVRGFASWFGSSAFAPYVQQATASR